MTSFFEKNVKIALYAIIFLLVAIENISNAKIENMEYLRTDYIESVKKTLSPLGSESLKKGSLLGLTKIKDGSKTTIIMMTNFHEGSPIYYLHSDGTISSDYLFNSEEPTSITDEINSIRICYRYSKCYEYAYVGNIELFLGKLIMQGNYIDNAGIRYMFNDDNTVMFSRKKFLYSIAADHVEIKADVLRLASGTEQRLYKFTVNNNILTLYAIHGDDNGVENEPSIILKKVEH